MENMETEPNDPINMGSQERRYGSEDQFVTNNFFEGLTKREYFTGQAIIGILSNSHPDVIDKHCVNGGWLHPGTVAKMAVQISDAIIEHLNYKQS